MTTQIVNVVTGDELKVAKTNGFFKLPSGKTVVGDLYANEKGEEQILIVNKEVTVTELGHHS